MAVRLSIGQAKPHGQAMPQQRWTVRHVTPATTVARPMQTTQVATTRPRRATVATASALDTSTTTVQIRRAAPPPPPPAPAPIEEEPPVELGGRMPAPLPQAWTDVLEACPDTNLGGGAFAEVFKVRHRRTGQCFAVKVMHRPNFVLRGIERQIEAEVEAMRAAARRGGQEAENILRLLDVAEDGDYVFLLLELCGGGDLLRRLIAAPTQRFTEEKAAMWARQLLLGLRTVHSLGYIHRDIKPDNLLLTDQSVLKIADFGWCCLVEEMPSCLAGTFQYMAPEVLRNVPQTPQADVWSAGVTLYQMLLGRALLTTYLGPGATQLTERDPHKSTAIKQKWLLEEIEAICPPAFDRRPADLSLACWDFLRQLLMPEPEQRATVDRLLEHPWLAG
eukprot:CAMPEP_0195109830 /NCGR_PEP_ID=MMETSP0448-20130528/90651_1 /TAXON_ID=66468 /ORGANISM="Heterocapsa triquestra, Strain CCMP 448" /LENGTH=390 /DNA_ID=CAMNT_0040146485 /DNA_START=60 /DNA_END=1229 /DNA_ORIENTATION=-